MCSTVCMYSMVLSTTVSVLLKTVTEKIINYLKNILVAKYMSKVLYCSNGVILVPPRLCAGEEEEEELQVDEAQL